MSKSFEEIMLTRDNWEQIGSDGESTTYYNPSDSHTLSKNADTVSMWVLVDYRTSQRARTTREMGSISVGTEYVFLSQLAKFEYNCIQNRYRQTWKSRYKKQMGSVGLMKQPYPDSPVDDDSDDYPWVDAQAYNYIVDRMKMTCITPPAHR